LEIQEIGVYWEVDSDNFLVNDYDKIELSDQLQSICSLFVEEIREFVQSNTVSKEDIHSAYLRGSFLNGTNTIYSDINFLVLGPDSGSEELLPYFNDHFSNLLKERFDIDIVVDTVIESVEFFLKDYLERFPIKCIWGEDLSLHRLDFDLITNECLDGTEKEDCKYLFDRLNATMMAASVIDIVGGYEWHLRGPAFIENFFRCALNTVCKKKKLWTRDLYYCYYFFSEEYPQFKDAMKSLLELYLNRDKSSEEIKDILLFAPPIIAFMEENIGKPNK